MAKLKLGSRLLIAFLVILFFILSLIPVGIFILVSLDNIVIPNIELGLFSGVLLAIVLLPMASAIYTRLLRAKWHRKLQALAVADELGIVPTTSIVIRRLIIMLEYSVWFIVAYLVSILFKIVNNDFTQISNLLMWLLVSFGLFTILLMVADGIKINKMNKQKVDDEYKLSIEQSERYAKRLTKKKKEAIKHAKVKKEIADLEKVLNED